MVFESKGGWSIKIWAKETKVHIPNFIKKIIPDPKVIALLFIILLFWFVTIFGWCAYIEGNACPLLKYWKW